ncbi:HAMP domain-containing histidine kinase [Acetobacter sp. AN02]|uniref:sensor histidine kinase n=1 Tax=Acetobacter sp. AN02 TaxID=2894186 RepID=UPI00243463EE|nr:ATP-binding protein [Acetobacter sp. AN02]MDG6094776.1 HAMP domain-containing histidine kinase [Acetobacter sp. AN02]
MSFFPLLVAAGIGGGVLCGWLAGCRSGVVSVPDVPPALPLAVPSDPCPSDVLKQILTILPFPALLLDHGCRLFFAGPEARAVLQDALGALIRHPALFIMFRAASENGTTESSDIPLDVPVRRLLRVTLVPLPQDLSAADAPLMLMLFEDISAQEAIERSRADFVAFASHELRTPLSALSGFIETLRGPAADDPDAQRQFLGIMAQQAGRMQKLVDRLLTLSRAEMLERRRPQGVIRTEALAEMLREETADFLAARDAVLELRVSAFSLPGDPDQMLQVLINLTENAAKYARVPGRVTHIVLSCAAHRAGDQDGVLLSVSDNGPGIEARHLPRLTERFYRAGQPSDDGTGLGLAIVSHSVDRHLGKLLIDSTPGEGTTFSVWLPLRPERPVPRERASLV